MEVLNVSLYRALCRYFGEGDENVRVAAEGQEINWFIYQDLFQQQSKKRPQRKVRDSGEEYVVKCPFCRDARQRLWVNHRWGHVDPATGQRNLWLAQCWNEQCLSDYGNQKQFFNWIYARGGADVQSKVTKGTQAAVRELCEVAPAGTLITLRDLVKHYPNHHLLEYLHGRYFDPLKLDKLYGVRYCADSRYTHGQDRLYIPVRHAGKLVGWQCRYIGDDVQGRSFNEMGIPKYFTCPGMARKHIAYNMELAMRHPTVVFVEGATDVWNFGPMATALLSTKISVPLLRKIAGTMKARFGNAATIVLMLDPEWDDRARKRKEHPMHTIENNLRKLPFKNVVLVWLPEGKDPGSLDRTICRQLAKDAGRKLGKPVTFSRPPCKLPDGG